jgi:hypothetical protein
MYISISLTLSLFLSSGSATRFHESSITSLLVTVAVGRRSLESDLASPWIDVSESDRQWTAGVSLHSLLILPCLHLLPSLRPGLSPISFSSFFSSSHSFASNVVFRLSRALIA